MTVLGRVPPLRQRTLPSNSVGPSSLSGRSGKSPTVQTIRPHTTLGRVRTSVQQARIGGLAERKGKGEAEGGVCTEAREAAAPHNRTLRAGLCTKATKLSKHRRLRGTTNGALFTLKLPSLECLPREGEEADNSGVGLLAGPSLCTKATMRISAA